MPVVGGGVKVYTFGMARKSTPSPKSRKVKPKASTSLTAATMRVLVADDYPYDRERVMDLLGLLGVSRSNMTVAEDGIQALDAIWESQRLETPFHLLVTDNQMPRAKGLEILEAVLYEDYPRAVMVSSDYTNPSIEVLERTFPTMRFLLKAHREALPDTVRELFPDVPFIGR